MPFQRVDKIVQRAQRGARGFLVHGGEGIGRGYQTRHILFKPAHSTLQRADRLHHAVACHHPSIAKEKALQKRSFGQLAPLLAPVRLTHGA